MLFFFVKQKTAYEMRISDWSSDVCSSDLRSGRSRPWNYFRGKFTLFRTTLSRSSRDRSERAVTIPSLSADGIPLLPLWYGRPRSEERRVGKECVSRCRSRWSPYHEKNKREEGI